MAEDWTVDIPFRTPEHQRASNAKTTMTGIVLDKPATLDLDGTLIRLRVSRFDSREEAEVACPRLCFGLRYMSLQLPIAMRVRATPQDVAFAKNPREAAVNVSQSFGGIDFGDEVHGIIQDGAPAIYETDKKVLMLSGGEVTYTITGIRDQDRYRALTWIEKGARGTLDPNSSPALDAAIELFNLAGFETSPRASFLIHCTALEQLYRPQPVDHQTLQIIENLEEHLSAQATSDTTKAELINRLKGRLGNLKSYSITSSVLEGVANTLAGSDPERAKEIKAEIKSVFDARHDLAHSGKANLGDQPQIIQDLLKRVILAQIGQL